MGRQLGGRGKIFAGDKIPPLNDGVVSKAPTSSSFAQCIYFKNFKLKNIPGCFYIFENIWGQVLRTFQSDLSSYTHRISYATSWLSPSALAAFAH